MYWNQKFTMTTPKGKEIGAVYDVDVPCGFGMKLEDINKGVDQMLDMVKTDKYNPKDVQITVIPDLETRPNHWRIRGRVFRE